MFQIEQQPPQEPSYIEPGTLELYKGIIEGVFPVDALQDRLDAEQGLEGFLSHSAFERRLGVLLSKGVKGVLMAVDLDYFKQFNDTQGHPVGDSLIQLAAQLLRRQTRTSLPTQEQREQRQNPNQPLDLLGRIGGDEFAVFFVGASESDARASAIRVRENIVTEARKAFPNYEREQTMSLGLTPVKPSDTVQTLRQRADKALYKAKKGRGSPDIVDSIVIN